MTTPSKTPRVAEAGRVALVTGSAKSIGWATVQALVADGVPPVLSDRDGAALGIASRESAYAARASALPRKICGRFKS